MTSVCLVVEGAGAGLSPRGQTLATSVEPFSLFVSHSMVTGHQSSHRVPHVPHLFPPSLIIYIFRRDGTTHLDQPGIWVLAPLSPNISASKILPFFTSHLKPPCRAAYRYCHSRSHRSFRLPLDLVSAYLTAWPPSTRRDRQGPTSPVDNLVSSLVGYQR